MKKINKNDNRTRLALWNTYNRKSFITHKPIDLSNMQIDHIIPQNIINDLMEFERIKKLCDLPEDFILDSFINLVPIEANENRRKSNIIYNDKALIHYLNITKNNERKFENIIKKSKDMDTFDESINSVRSNIYKENKVNQDMLHKTFYSLIDEESEFHYREEVKVDNDFTILWSFRKMVGIEAILPKYNNVVTKCKIFFKSVTLKNCIFELENKDILQILFKNVNTRPDLFIRGIMPIRKSEENVELVIKNVRILLPYNDYLELCEVIDFYYNNYKRKINYIEKLLRTRRFPLSERLNNYKMVEISYTDWIKLIKYTEKYDANKGNSEEYIFDYKYSMISVFTEKDNDNFEYGYHAIFHIEHHPDYRYYSTITSSKVALTWELIEDRDFKGEDNFSKRRIWDAEIAYHWLTKEIFPKVRIDINKNKNEISDVFDQRVFHEIAYLCRSVVHNLSDIKDISKVLYNFFQNHCNELYLINREAIIKFYDILIYLLKRTRRLDIYYVEQKLSLPHMSNKENLISNIEKRITEIKDYVYQGKDLDYLFRALWMILDSGKIKLNEQEVKGIFNNLEKFNEIHDNYLMLDKYGIDFI